MLDTFDVVFTIKCARSSLFDFTVFGRGVRNLTSILDSSQCRSFNMIFWIRFLVRIPLISLLTMECRPIFDDTLYRVFIEKLFYRLNS
uniref:Uncharacterized protein n=1 Tax=Brugia malayi TaxID=6279 RepID=A0A912GZK8_BRUMA